MQRVASQSYGSSSRVVGAQELPNRGRELGLDPCRPERHTGRGELAPLRARAAASSVSSESSWMKPSAASCGNVSPVAVRGQRLGVERVLGAAPGDDRRPGLERQPHLAGDELLRLVDEGVDRLARRAEPEALVDELGPARLELALGDELGLRQDEVLERLVRGDQRDRRGRLVDLAALDADGAVLDHVDPADPVGAGEPVQRRDQLVRAAAPRRRATPGTPASKPITTSTGAGAVGSAVSAYGSSGGAVHGSSRMPASIARPNRFSSIENGEACFASTGIPLGERVRDLLVARPDLVAQRRDHPHARVLRLERELEAQLVVALAGAAVDDRLGAELERDLGDRLGDHGPRERGDERVLALVERVRLERLRAPARPRTRPCGRPGRRRRRRPPCRADRRLEVELLADVDEHGDDLVEAVVLLQPGDRCSSCRARPSRRARRSLSCVSFQVVRRSSLAELAPAVPSRAATKIVFSPAIVPATSAVGPPRRSPPRARSHSPAASG